MSNEERNEWRNLKKKLFYVVKPANIALCFPGSKYISKSEDNLLTPQCDSSVHRTSWCGETPVGAQAFGGGSFTDTPMNMCLKSSYKSEPAIVVSKPPAVASLPKKLCCASSAESLESECSIIEAQSLTGPTLLKKIKTLTELGSDPQAVIQQPCSSPGTDQTKPSDSVLLPPPGTPTVLQASRLPAQQSLLANDQNITFGQIEIAALSPLHIDSAIFESGVYCSPVVTADKGFPCEAPSSSHSSFTVEESDREVGQVNCSRLIEALDIQSPALFRVGVTSGLQSTPYKLDLELRDEIGTIGGALHDESSQEIGTKIQNQQPLSPRSLETEKRRVAEHIEHFNKLTLHSPRGTKASHVRSPLKFQRTPVRQTVRRMNSLLGESRRPTRNSKLATSQSSPVVKAVSMESGLSPHPQLQPYQDDAQMGLSHSVQSVKRPPPVPPKKPSTLARKVKVCALGDVTNKVQPKPKMASSDPAGAQKPLVQQIVEKDTTHYRGSPRNPLNQGRLMSATKPVDL